MKRSPDSYRGQQNHYYPFGMNMKGSWSGGSNKYQYNGKELNEDFGLDWLDYGARWYDAGMGRWGQVDPLADSYYSYSPYNYALNNPIRFLDPDGRSVAGDYYKKDGTHIGSDGIDDNKVYVTENHINDVETAQVVNDIETGEVQELGITHEQFQQFAANVYNEAPHESSEEKDKVASAIVNRKETSSQGGNWNRTLDKIMFNKDSHEKKMEAGRTNPKKGEKIEGTNISASKVATENYQNFYNASPMDRNNDAGMKDATRATINGLTGPDKVNGANSWRGKGQGKGNRFFKEKVNSEPKPKKSRA